MKKRVILLAILASCTLWMCTDNEFENHKEKNVGLLDRSAMRGHVLLPPDSADTLCSTLVTAIPGVGGCNVLLQAGDSTTLNPLNPHPQFVLGSQYLIGYRHENRSSICMMGQVVRLLCVQPADSTSVK